MNKDIMKLYAKKTTPSKNPSVKKLHDRSILEKAPADMSETK